MFKSLTILTYYLETVIILLYPSCYFIVFCYCIILIILSSIVVGWLVVLGLTAL